MKNQKNSFFFSSSIKKIISSYELILTTMRNSRKFIKCISSTRRYKIPENFQNYENIFLKQMRKRTKNKTCDEFHSEIKWKLRTTTFIFFYSFIPSIRFRTIKVFPLKRIFFWRFFPFVAC